MASLLVFFSGIHESNLTCRCFPVVAYFSDVLLLAFFGEIKNIDYIGI